MRARITRVTNNSSNSVVPSVEIGGHKAATPPRNREKQATCRCSYLSLSTQTEKGRPKHMNSTQRGDKTTTKQVVYLDRQAGRQILESHKNDAKGRYDRWNVNGISDILQELQTVVGADEKVDGGTRSAKMEKDRDGTDESNQIESKGAPGIHTERHQRGTTASSLTCSARGAIAIQVREGLLERISDSTRDGDSSFIR